MADYIERNKAKSYLAFGIGTVVPASEALDQVPAADVIPVIHGQWKWDTQDIYCCTNCNEKVHVKEVMGIPDWKYCPNCGAKMNEGKNDAAD